VQSTRWYPYGTTAAHLLGHLRRDDDSKEGEEAFFSFRLPDYRGDVGIEVRRRQGAARHRGREIRPREQRRLPETENVWIPAEPGRNVVLTLDLQLQQAAEQALQVRPLSPATRGAVVVMECTQGTSW